jgi:hypothetical protein
MSQIVQGRIILPKMMTLDTTTIMAIIVPRFNVMLSLSDPAAPASLSPALPSFALEASPGSAPFPGCCGAEVARLENTDATEADDMAGVRLIVEVVVIVCAAVQESRKAMSRSVLIFGEAGRNSMASKDNLSSLAETKVQACGACDMRVMPFVMRFAL